MEILNFIKDNVFVDRDKIDMVLFWFIMFVDFKDNVFL